MLKLNCLGILSPLTEFGAVARTYPVACSGVRQRNFDFFISLDFIHPKFILIYISSQSEVNYLCIQLSNIFYLILPILYNLLFSG